VTLTTSPFGPVTVNVLAITWWMIAVVP